MDSGTVTPKPPSTMLSTAECIHNAMEEGNWDCLWRRRSIRRRKHRHHHPEHNHRPARRVWSRRGMILCTSIVPARHSFLSHGKLPASTMAVGRVMRERSQMSTRNMNRPADREEACHPPGAINIRPGGSRSLISANKNVAFFASSPPPPPLFHPNGMSWVDRAVVPRSDARQS
jgi:hypothetical protein